MRSIAEIKKDIDDWVSRKLLEVEKEEQEFKVFEIPLNKIRKPMPDWADVYKNIPVTFDELIDFDRDKKTKMLKLPKPPNECI